jgi:3-phosphoglycerate kinase
MLPLNSRRDGVGRNHGAGLHAQRFASRSIISALLQRMRIAKRSTPKGREPRLSLKPAAEYLSSVLGAEVPLAPDCVGEPTERMVESLAAIRALLLEA